MSDHTLLVIITWLGVAIVLLLIAVLITKWYTALHYREVRMLLAVATDMATSARINRKETALAVGKMQEQLEGHPTREDLAKTLEEVPDRTAAKVVEKLPESRDDWRGHGG